MGYRSDVYIKVDKQHKEELVTILAEGDLLDYSCFAEDDDFFSVTLHYVKWYDVYNTVDAVNNFVDRQDVVGGLIAIGEDNVILERGEPYYVDMHTRVSVNGIPSGKVSKKDLSKDYPELFL